MLGLGIDRPSGAAAGGFPGNRTAVQLQRQIETGVVQDTPYQYFYYLIDTAENQTTATAYYALKETPTEQVVQTVSLERVAEDWSSFKLDGNTWTKEQYSVSNYYNETDGLKYNLSRSSTDLSSKTLESLISIWLPLA